MAAAQARGARGAFPTEQSTLKAVAQAHGDAEAQDWGQSERGATRRGVRKADENKAW